jgi:hypothetical protein
MQPMYMQMQQAATPQRLAAAQNQNGRVTPQGQPSRSPINPNAATAQRGSPIVTNQGLSARSPMPNSQPMTHTNQHPNFPTMAQSPYNHPQLRPIPNGQRLQQHMANGGPPAGGPSPILQGQQVQPSQDQQGHNTPMMPQYYSYPMNYGGVPHRFTPGYPWPMGIGRGVPTNGPLQMPGMLPNAAHSQQMLNVGKAVPGGMQGR